MSHVIPWSLVLLLTAATAVPAHGQPTAPPPVIASAIAQAANRSDVKAPVPHQPVAGARYGPSPRRRGATRHAVLTGALIGAALGGAIAYREWGAEGTWYGVYSGGIPGALVGWRASR
jgi:hypothetical protein